MNTELMLKRAILFDKGWEYLGDRYAHYNRGFEIWAVEVDKMTVEQLKRRIS